MSLQLVRPYSTKVQSIKSGTVRIVIFILSKKVEFLSILSILCYITISMTKINAIFYRFYLVFDCMQLYIHLVFIYNSTQNKIDITFQNIEFV